MTTKETDLVEKIKAWSFSLLVSILSYFGVQTMKKLDLAVHELKDLNSNVRQIEVIQGFHTKEIDKLEIRIEKIESDNTRFLK